VSAAVLYMSMSLDGFIAGPNERPDNPLGDGGHRLHDWFTVHDESGAAKFEVPSGVNGQIFEEMLATGAVVAGAGTFEPAGGWGAITTTPCRSSSTAVECRESTSAAGPW
jgi:hypothetical protein